MITLNRRMSFITDMVDKTPTLADVGCDHGKIGVWLLQHERADKVFFCDISAPSLDKARLLAAEKCVDSRAGFFCRDGLGDIVCHTAIIAGMGGMEILSILKNAHTLPEKLVLQPMKDSIALRKELSDKYTFEKDFLIYGGDKYYDIMKLSRGSDTFSQQELVFGKTNIRERSPDFLRYLEKEYALARRVMELSDNQQMRRREQLIKELL